MFAADAPHAATGDVARRHVAHMQHIVDASFRVAFDFQAVDAAFGARHVIRRRTPAVEGAGVVLKHAGVAQVSEAASSCASTSMHADAEASTSSLSTDRLRVYRRYVRAWRARRKNDNSYASTTTTRRQTARAASAYRNSNHGHSCNTCMYTTKVRAQTTAALLHEARVTPKTPAIAMRNLRDTTRARIQCSSVFSCEVIPHPAEIELRDVRQPWRTVSLPPCELAVADVASWMQRDAEVAAKGREVCHASTNEISTPSASAMRLSNAFLLSLSHAGSLLRLS